MTSARVCFLAGYPRIVRNQDLTARGNERAERGAARRSGRRIDHIARQGLSELLGTERFLVAEA